MTDLDQQAIAITRGLAMDAPRAANSGHPGTAMALAPLARVLFGRVMRYDPAEPLWPDRDRFVLSAGHASILLYSQLFLHGFDLTLDDLRAFRQWGSRTPGHPEVHHTRGVEVTTGPLGQGLAQSVGLALAERMLRARFGSEVVDHRTFVIAGDGCLQEGVSHEAASLAGHLGLGRLVVVYDDNHITIDGSTDLSSSDDAAARFAAYGWDVQRLGEIGDDLDALEAAVVRAAADEDRPTLLVLRTHIGTPSPMFTDSPKAHGDPFPPEEIARTKELLGIPSDESFWAPDDIVAAIAGEARERGATARREWQARLDGYRGDRAGLEAAWSGEPLGGVDALRAVMPAWNAGESVATRVAVQKALDASLPLLPGLVSGSADLTGNTGTKLSDAVAQSASDHAGRQIHFGIREHAMAAAMNGMALHGGVLPVGGTFFVFSDYMRPAVRLAAMSEAKALFFWTHDSVGLGEDGPTHQPIEHLASLRAMPGLRVIRPADANETATALFLAATSTGPTGLVLSRQAVTVCTPPGAPVERGAYVLRDMPGAQVTIIGTGSEVAVCMAAADQLADAGIASRVVSMPSWDLFEAQDDDYREQVLAPELPSLSVEAGSTFGWSRYADDSIGIDRFGASAPGPVALANLGINADHVAARARALAQGAS